MPKFDGFKGNPKFTIQIPEEFFTRVLQELDDPGEMKSILFVFWYLQAREENTGYATRKELLADPVVAGAFGTDTSDREKKFTAAVAKAVKRGVLLTAHQDNEDYTIINSPRGKALLTGLNTGDWRAKEMGLPTISLADERPDICSL